jgi:hypothetical protein
VAAAALERKEDTVVVAAPGGGAQRRGGQRTDKAEKADNEADTAADGQRCSAAGMAAS